MRTTTSYGTWASRVHSVSLEDDVRSFINNGDAEWHYYLEESGALQQIQDTYWDAIDAALPDSITLCGDEFIGPYSPDDDEFDDYPHDDDGDLDIKAIIDDIELGPIVERHDVTTLEEIGRHVLESKAENPAKVAASTMGRLKVKPFEHVPHPESNRTVAVYWRSEVNEALSNRPGRGKRTDLQTNSQ